MGADIHVKGNLSLGDEGELVTLIQSWKEPGADEVDSIELHSDNSLHHYPHCLGSFRVIKVTDEKKVLFCKRCGLRLSIPISLINIKDLREYLKK